MSKKNRAGKLINKQFKNMQVTESTEDIAKRLMAEKNDPTKTDIIAANIQANREKEAEEKKVVVVHPETNTAFDYDTGEITDPNFQSVLDELEGKESEEIAITTLNNNNNKESADKQADKNKGGNKMKNNQLDKTIGGGFERPLSKQYGVTSIEMLKKFSTLVETKLPELAKCIMQATVAVSTVSVQNNGRVEQEDVVKYVLKLNLANSEVLNKENRGESQTYDANRDSLFEAAFEAASNEANLAERDNWKRLPKYMKENGNGILFSDYFDVLKFEPHRDKNGKVWHSLVEMHVNASASILTILGDDPKYFVGYTKSVRRMKSMEESVKLKQKMRGHGMVQVPSIYWVQICVDDLELIKSGTAMFKKPAQNQGESKQDKYKAALAEFVGK